MPIFEREKKMISISEMKRLEGFILYPNSGCVFKQVYSDGSEKVYVEYSGMTVLEIVNEKIEGIVFCHWQDNIPKNWESEIQEIEKKIKEFPWKKSDPFQRLKDRVYDLRGTFVPDESE